MGKIKKIWPQLLIGAIVITFLGVAYYNKGFQKNQEQEQINMSNQAVDEEIGYRPEDYVTLGQYKGLEYQQSKVDVSDKELEEAIQDELLDYKKVDRAAQKEDSVNINYTAYIDDKKESNLSEEDFDMTIGEEDLAKEFDDAVTGKKAGEKVSVTIKDVSNLPTEGTENYSGKEVKFEITINKVSEPYYHELTDKWVESNYDAYECHTVKEFRKIMKDSMMEENREARDEDTRNQLWQMVIDNSEMNKYPQELYDDVVYKDNADMAYWADYWGMSVEEYYEFNGMTDEDINNMYLDDVKSEMLMWAIAKAEGINVTDEEIEQGYYDLFESCGYDSAEAMKEDYSDFEIKLSLLEEQIIDLIVENAVITETESTETEE